MPEDKRSNKSSTTTPPPPPVAPASPPAPPDPKEPETKLVKMRRAGQPGVTSGPTTADVHPAEVENYRRGDWVLVEDAKK